MIQFVKFLAFTVSLAFAGTEAVETVVYTSHSHDLENDLTTHENFESIAASPDTLKKDGVDVTAADIEEVDISKVSQIPLQPSKHHGCGMDHAHEVMRSMDPDYDKKLEHFTNVTLPELQERGRQERASKSSANTLINMPIVFHIIHKPGESIGQGQNLTDQTIIDQLETLNEDLQALNSGWANVPTRWENIKGNPMLQFCLAEVDPNGDPTTGIVRHEYSSVPDRNYIRTTIKPQTHWPTTDYYNVWILPIPGTTANGGVLGWAFFPSAHGANFDGTVQDYRFTGKGGKTLTHEVGHSFGLPHTWGNSGGCGNDDGIADTPLQAENTNSVRRMSCNGLTWPVGPTTCNEEHMYINYMDYSPDACALTFTIGQGDAMRGIANTTRASLIPSANSVAASCSAGTPTGGGNPTGGGGPPVTIEYDAGIQTIISPVDEDFCGSQEITPVVLLVNSFGDTPLTSCEIRYKISGTPGSVLFNWTGNLAKGESEEVTLAPFTSPEFSFEFTTWTDNPNGEDDENGFNDEKAVSLVTPDVVSANIFEDFEGENDLPTSTDIISIDPGVTVREWEIADDVSAYGIGNECVYFRNFFSPDSEGSIDILEFPVVDFSDIENPRLGFDVAYYNTTSIAAKDSLRVRVSTDCGSTFTTVFLEGGADLATASAQQQVEFTPQPNEWKNEVVELFQFTDAERVVIEIANIGYGNNNLYIDNINLSDGCASSVQVQVNDLACAEECTGSVDLILNGFVDPPQITWSGDVNAQTGASLTDLCAGDYSVTVYDAVFDCEFIQEITVASPDELEIVVNGTDISAPGLDNGSVAAQAFGGTGFYTFNWEPAAPGEEDEAFMFGLDPGEYCVTVTDQAGCSKTECVEVLGFDCDMEITLDITQPTCDGQPGSAVLTISGANSTSILWSQGGPIGTGGFLFNETVNNNLTGGQVFVNITDTALDDCEETFVFEIFPAIAPNIIETIQDETGPGNNDGSITLNVNGSSDYAYDWSTGTSTTEELTGIGAGTYTVTLTDVNNGCTYTETYNITNLNCTLQASADITPVSCFDETDGQIVINASGGTGSYDYAWPSGPSFPAQFNLAAGIYPITVTDDGGCRLVVEAVLEQPSFLTAILTTTDESSPGALDGSVSAEIFGGTSPYDIVWSNGAMDVQMIDGLGGGLYFITITDDNGCSTVKGTSVEGLECDVITLSANSIPVTCFGENDGVLNSTVDGGVGPYTYLWTPGDYNQANVSNVPPGDYTLTIMDAEGCPATATTTVTEPDEFIIMLDGTNETSLGANDGTITSTVTGGVGTIFYEWSGPTSFSSNAPNLSLLAPAEYCVAAVDQTGCFAEACFTIGAGNDPCAGYTSDAIIFETVIGVSCQGEADATITATINAGVGPYTYEWSNSDTDANATNVSAGTISVTITDSQNCQASAEFEVVDPPAIDVDANVTPLSAPGSNDGSIILAEIANTVGMTSCSWTGPDSYTSTSCSITDLEPGTYTLTIIDGNNCEFTGTYTVVGEADPCLNFVFVDIITEGNSCTGGAEGQATVLVEGGQEPYTYEWSSLADQVTAVGLPAGVVSVTVTDANNCVVGGEAIITEPEVPLNLTATALNETAPGANNGSASATLSGGDSPYSYLWSGPNGFTATTMTIENLSPGEYCVIGTDGNGCMIEECVTVSAANDPCENIIIEVILSAGELNCFFSETEVSYVAEGGQGPYSIVWSVDNQTTDVITVEDAGEVTATVTDANGCIGEAEITIVENVEIPDFILLPTNPSTLTSTDGGAEVTLIGEDNFEVTWTDATGDILGSQNMIADLSIGLYFVVVTNTDNGCSTQQAFELTADGPDCTSFSISAEIEQITCFGFENGVAQIDVSNGTGPFIYNWNLGLIDSPIQSDLAPGTYEVTVTDALGCTDNISIDITEPEELTVGITVTEVSSPGANDGSLMAVVSGGTPDYSYQWTNISTAPTISGLGEGEEYCVTVVDENGCVAEACAALEILTNECIDFEVELVFTNQISCFEANDGALQVNIINAVEPVTYEWTNGLPPTQQQTDLGPGVYGVFVIDANNCIYEAELELTQPESELTIELSSTIVSSPGASDGTATVVANGGNEGEPYFYIWDDVNQQMSSTAIDLAPGVYCVTVASGDCFAEDCVEVFNADDPCLDFSAEIEVSGASCFEECDGTGIVIASGGDAPYSYIWSDGEEGAERTDICGLGSVTVTDANGCSTILEFFVDVPDELEVVTSSSNSTEMGADNGSANAAAFGGTAPYTYSWSNSTLGTDINNLAPDTYTVTVTDANGCTVEATVVVGIGEDLCSSFQGTIEVNDVTCFGGDDASAIVVAEGGFGTLLYDWSNSNTLGAGQANMSAGDFVVVVTDQNGCELILEGTIQQPDELIIEVISTQETSNETSSDGAATIAVSGGTGDITVTWPNGETGLSIDGLAAGEYEVVVVDENGCTTSELITITNGDGNVNMEDCENLTASFAITPVSCFNALDGAIEVIPSGGAEPYTVSSNLNSLVNLPAVTVVITVEDDNGCIYEEEVVIPGPNLLNANAQGFDGNCGLSASAEVIVSGGTPPFTTTWDNGETGPFITGLETGTYGVTIVDANGCETESEVEVVKEFEPLGFEVQTTDATCNDREDGRIQIEVSNFSTGEEPTYLWSDGVITKDRLNLPGGTYTVTITDANGCEYILSNEILAPDAVAGSYTVAPGSTNTLFDVTVSATGGTSPYSYSWSDNSFGFFNQGLAIGEYEVTITDDNGCQEIIDVVLNGTTSTLDNLDVITEFELSPNPTNGQFYLDITLSQISDIQITIYDILGQQIINNAYTGDSFNERLDLTEAAAGTYFVRVHNAQGQLTKKLIKVD